MRTEAPVREAALAARWPAALVVAAYLLAGLVGHEPWKPDEGHVFGVVFHMLQTGDWVVPRLAGEPFVEKPPFFYFVASVTARLFSGMLALHDGARLAGAGFVLLAMGCVGAAARKLFGEGAGERGALLLIACFGIVQHAHELIPDLPLLAGFAVAFLGLAEALDRPRRGGLLLGTGVGLGFLSKGLLAPAVFMAACALLPLFAAWRSRAYAAALAWAALACAPWVLVWPWALYSADPALFAEWFWTNNFGRYLGSARLGAEGEAWYYTTTLPWFAFPAWPLALVAAVTAHRRPQLRQGVILCGVVFAAIAFWLCTSSSARQLYALPFLVPLAVAAAGARTLAGERVASRLTWAFGGVALALAIGVWGVWAYGVFQGHPPGVPLLLRWFPADFEFRFDPRFFFAALALCAAWIAVWVPSQAQAPWERRWVANLALAWGLPMTLWLPWIDAAKSFRTAFEELARHLPPSPCVSSSGLGEPQRAMLHYYAGLKTRREETADAPCPVRLMQVNDAKTTPTPDWHLLWEGARDGEERERFRLYYRPRVRTSAIQAAGRTMLEPAP